MSDHNVRARINIAPTLMLCLAAVLAFLFWPIEALFPSTRGFVAYTFFGTPQERLKYTPVFVVLLGAMGIVFGLAALMTICASMYPMGLFRIHHVPHTFYLAPPHPAPRTPCPCGTICSPSGLHCGLAECPTSH